MDDKIWSALALASAWACATPAHAAAAAPPQAAASTADADRRLADAVMGWLDKILAVPDTPDVDPPLHDAVQALATDHLARMRRVLPAWIADEHAHAAPAASDSDIARALHNRIVNEIALWRLESPGPAYDAILLRAIQRPGLCDLKPRASYLGLLQDVFQAVPPADRPTLLAGERTLLAHWGTPRAGLAPAPASSLAEDEAATIARLRAGAQDPEAPMVPVLASSVLKDPPAEPWDSLTCARHQWGLAQALRRGDAPAQALLAWRYATIRTAGDWMAADGNRGATEYPLTAQRNGVSGWVSLRVTVDAQGRYASAAIADRHLVVPGVRDNPPAAFATVFDTASIAMGPSRFKPVTPKADGSPPGPVIMKIDWSLQ